MIVDRVGALSECFDFNCRGSIGESRFNLLWLAARLARLDGGQLSQNVAEMMNSGKGKKEESFKGKEDWRDATSSRTQERDR